MYTHSYEGVDEVEMWTVGKSFGFVQQFYYHLTNQSNSGGCRQFPVANEVVLENLRLVQYLENGDTNDVVLYDIDGEPLNRLDCSTVFLDSLDIPVFHRSSIQSVSLTGSINVNQLFVQSTFRGEIEKVNVNPIFEIRFMNPLPGTYEAININGSEGQEYTIGTFGISAVTDF